jgi:DNA-binding NtrC family response regulator
MILEMMVLLVEDQDMVREILAELLADEGLDVEQASSAEEALDLVKQGHVPDAVTTDIDLGAGASGLWLGSQLAHRTPRIGVVYITGRPWLIQHHVMIDGERFVQKPCRASVLLAAIEAVTH